VAASVTRPESVPGPLITSLAVTQVPAGTYTAVAVSSESALWYHSGRQIASSSETCFW